MAAPTYRTRITYRDPYTYRGVETGGAGVPVGTYRGPIKYRDAFTYRGHPVSEGPHFFPPTDQIVPPIYIDPPDPYYPCDPLMQRLMAHYESQFRGRNVFLLSDGTFTEEQPANWNADDPTAPYATVFDATSGAVVVTEFDQIPHVVKVYWGGVDNPVTAAEATALTAAGYTVST